MPFHGLGIELPYAALLGGVQPPAGFVFILDSDGSRLLDSDGQYMLGVAF